MNEEKEVKDPALESLRNDIAQVGPHLMEIAGRVIDEGISEFPVFVASFEMVDIGKPIFDRDVVQLNWFFNASILEDFVRKNIVKKENLNRFQRVYGNPKEEACIFMITPDEAKFVFVPYVIEDK